MDWSTIVSLGLGWLAQQAKAYQKIPTPVVQAATFGLAIGLYAFKVKPNLDDVAWFENAVTWAMAVLGFSSVTGATGLAPKTDSKPGGPILKPTVPFLVLSMLLVASLAYAAPLPPVAPPDEVLVYAPQFLQTTPGGTADTKPWYSTDNLSIATGASYRWWNGGDAEHLTPNKEFVFGLYNAWQLTEHVDAIGNVEYGVDTKSTGFTVGARFVLKMPK